MPSWASKGSILGPQGKPGAGPFTAPSGSWQQPQVFGSSPGSPISGALIFQPFDVGPATKTFTALGVNVSQAQVGGTTTTTLAVYADDGSGGRPNTAAGPIVSGTVTLTAAGARSASVSWTATPGRYWLAFLYVATAAPTTVATLFQLTSGPSLWTAGASGSASGILPGATYGDTFNRSDNSALGGTDSGSAGLTAWSQARGTCRIAGATAQGAGTSDTAIIQTGTGIGTYQTTIAVQPVGSSELVGLVVRSNSGGTTSNRIYSSASSYQGDGFTTIATVTPAAGDVLRVVDFGTYMNAYVNSTLILQVTGLSAPTSTYSWGGIVFNSPNAPAALTNWSWASGAITPALSGPGNVATVLYVGSQTSMPSAARTLAAGAAGSVGGTLVGALAA